MTALMAATEDIRPEKVLLLCELCADVNKSDSRGRTALLIATERRIYSSSMHKSIIDMLVVHGASLESRDLEGRTPLHQAVNRCHLCIVQIFVSFQKDLDVKDSTGATPLHLAVLSSAEDIVEELVLAGAGVNCVDNTGQTPLHIAARLLSHEILQFLLAHGGDCELKDRFGMTAADHAEAMIRNQDIIDLLSDPPTANLIESDRVGSIIKRLSRCLRYTTLKSRR